MKVAYRKYKKGIERVVFYIGIISIVLILGGMFSKDTGIVNDLYQGFKGFLDIISPMIYAFMLAYICNPLMKGVEKKLGKGIHKASVNRIVSILIVFLMIGVMGIGLGYALVPPIVENIEGLVVEHPQIQSVLEELKHKVAFDKEIIVSELQQITQSTDWLQAGILYIQEVIGDVGSLLVDSVATIILTFYFLKDQEDLKRAIACGMTVLFPQKFNAYSKILLKDIDTILGGFITGTILAGIVVGVISSTLMTLIGHPFAVLIGTVAGIMNMIPYVGPLVGAALALALGLLESVELAVLGCVLLLVYQQIDGNFIEPKIVGDKIGLPAVWILITVIIGGSYFGAVGMVLSAPVAALVKVYMIRAYTYKIQKKDPTFEKISEITYNEGRIDAVRLSK